jgi:hypothetical protein
MVVKNCYLVGLTFQFVQFIMQFVHVGGSERPSLSFQFVEMLGGTIYNQQATSWRFNGKVPLRPETGLQLWVRSRKIEKAITCKLKWINSCLWFDPSRLYVVIPNRCRQNSST